MPKFRIQISIDNEDEDPLWIPYVSPHWGLRRVIVIWGWLYVEAKLLKG